VLRCAAAEKRSPAGADQKDPMSALVNQLHGGFQLRPTALGHHIRGRDSTPGQHPYPQNSSPVCAFLSVARYKTES